MPYCSQCGGEYTEGTAFCPYCDSSIETGTTNAQANLTQDSAPTYEHPDHQVSQKSKIVAGILQILLPFGIGRFYLGYMGTGVLQMLTSWFCGIGAIWCIIDGVLILVGNVTDVNGRPLKD